MAGGAAGAVLVAPKLVRAQAAKGKVRLAYLQLGWAATEIIHKEDLLGKRGWQPEYSVVPGSPVPLLNQLTSKNVDAIDMSFALAAKAFEDGAPLKVTGVAKDVLGELNLLKIESKSTGVDGHAQAYTADNTKININSATLDIGTNSETVGGITLISGSITGTSPGALTSASTVQTQSGSISATLAGTTGLTQSTAGTTILSGANTYRGQTTVDGGTLTLANDTAAGTGSIVVNSTTGGIGVTGTRIAVEGGINVSNSLSLASDSNGDIRSNLFSNRGNNAWSGPITLNGSGVIAFAGNSGTSLNITGEVSGPTFTGSFIGARSATSNFVATISNTIDLPASTLGLAVTNAATLILNSTDNHFSSVRISHGTLRLGANNALPTDANVTIGISNGNAGTFDLAGFDQKISGVTVASGAVASIQTIGNSSASSDSILTIAGGESSFAGVICDSLGTGTRMTSLQVTSGSFTLGGANTYTGATTVRGGFLLVNGSVVGNIIVNSGATLGGTGTVGRVTTSEITGITLNSGGHLAPGSGGPSILRSTFTNFAPGSSFDSLILGRTLGTQYSQLVASSGSSLNGATLNVKLGLRRLPEAHSRS